MLTSEEICDVNWNDFSTEDINCLIDMQFICEQDIIDYYNNEFWRDNV